jgi:hypothetical protein
MQMNTAQTAQYIAQVLRNPMIVCTHSDIVHAYHFCSYGNDEARFSRTTWLRGRMLYWSCDWRCEISCFPVRTCSHELQSRCAPYSHNQVIHAGSTTSEAFCADYSPPIYATMHLISKPSLSNKPISALGFPWRAFALPSSSVLFGIVAIAPAISSRSHS